MMKTKSFARNPLVGQFCNGTGGTHCWSFVSLVMSLLCILVKCTISPCSFLVGLMQGFHRHCCICPCQCHSKIKNVFIGEMAMFLLWDRCKEEVRAAAIVSLSLGISSGPQQSNWTLVIHLGNNDDEKKESLNKE